MSLPEGLMAALVFAFSASASLQLWASGQSWQQRAELRRSEQSGQEARVLALQGRLGELAGTPLAHDCGTAAARLVEQLAVEQPGLRQQGEAVVLELAGAEGSRRERWYDPAAYGLCGLEAGDGQG
jgi:hypothetical protein